MPRRSAANGLHERCCGDGMPVRLRAQEEDNPMKIVAWIAAAVLVACVARGDDIHKETNSIKSLNPQQAKALITEMNARLNKSVLRLDGLTTLDATTAREIADFSGALLSINGLAEIDAQTAKALAGFKGRMLELRGLKSLSSETAEALVNFKGNGAGILEFRLNLDGLPAIDAATARLLARFKGGVILDGVTTLDADAAKALVAFKGEKLWLEGLTSLNADAAKALRMNPKIVLPKRLQR